jgi:hypothetical protein
MKFDWNQLREKWPSTIVARDRVDEFSGGVLNPRSLANADCLGIGPKERFLVGKKVVYTVDSLIEYIKSKMIYPEEINFKPVSSEGTISVR